MSGLFVVGRIEMGTDDSEEPPDCNEDWWAYSAGGVNNGNLPGYNWETEVEFYTPTGFGGAPDHMRVWYRVADIPNDDPERCAQLSSTIRVSDAAWTQLTDAVFNAAWEWHANWGAFHVVPIGTHATVRAQVFGLSIQLEYDYSISGTGGIFHTGDTTSDDTTWDVDSANPPAVSDSGSASGSAFPIATGLYKSVTDGAGTCGGPDCLMLFYEGPVAGAVDPTDIFTNVGLFFGDWTNDEIAAGGG